MTSNSKWWPEALDKDWERKRARGKWRFIIGYGIFTWGAIMFLVLGVCPALFNIPFRGEMSARYLGEALVSWSTGGILLGTITWYVSEHLYRKFHVPP